MVRPPALGGRKIGTLASRTPHRPNPIGTTVVRLLRVSDGITTTDAAGRPAADARPDGTPGRAGEPAGGWVLVSGVDFTEGTPVLDVKPLVAPCDCPSDAVVPAWVASLPGSADAARPVFWAPGALAAAGELCRSGRACRLYGGDEATSLVRAVSEVLGSDVRSARQRGGGGAVRDAGAALSLDVDGVSAWYRRVSVPAGSAWAAEGGPGGAVAGSVRVPMGRPGEDAGAVSGALADVDVDAVLVWAVSREGSGPPEEEERPAEGRGTEPGATEVDGAAAGAEEAAGGEEKGGSGAGAASQRVEAAEDAADDAADEAAQDEEEAAREAWLAQHAAADASAAAASGAAPSPAAASGATSWELLTNSMAP